MPSGFGKASRAFCDQSILFASCLDLLLLLTAAYLIEENPDQLAGFGKSAAPPPQRMNTGKIAAECGARFPVATGRAALDTRQWITPVDHPAGILDRLFSSGPACLKWQLSETSFDRMSRLHRRPGETSQPYILVQGCDASRSFL